jgi:hypothetical protein
MAGRRRALTRAGGTQSTFGIGVHKSFWRSIFAIDARRAMVFPFGRMYFFNADSMGSAALIWREGGSDPKVARVGMRQ